MSARAVRGRIPRARRRRGAARRCRRGARRGAPAVAAGAAARRARPRRRMLVDERAAASSTRARHGGPACARNGSSTSSIGVRQVGDLRLLDHARRALQRVRQPQQLRHVARPPARRCSSSSVPLPELLQELARLDAEVLVGIAAPWRQRLGAHQAQQARATASPAATTVCSVCAELASVSRVACATFAIATLTCSTAVACCLVRQLDLARRLGGGARPAPAICLNDAATSRELLAPASTAFEPVSVAITVVLTALRTSSISAADLLGRPADAIGQLADLVGHHREALARLAGARRLDGGVDGQDVGLLGELGDDVEDAADLLRLLAEVEHVIDDQIDLAPDAGDRLVAALDGGVARRAPRRRSARRSGPRAGRSRRSGARSRAAR